jgi:1,4-dihydroxy-6-naphthoate synthase
MQLTLGYSPCPNDTFIFHALVKGLVEAPGVRFAERLQDVETLNRMALDRELDVTKVSYGVLPRLLDDYALLRSGGALGRGCGPLLVAREALRPEDLRDARVAIPGRLTTANLLLQQFAPDLPPGEELIYSEIMPAVARGDFAAGVIIHESRFTYPEHGLELVVDLGEWWEAATGSPIPLGAIVARRELGADRIRDIEDAIRRSVHHAFHNPTAPIAYINAHAQEMEPDVIRRHIELYVNEFSLDLGPEGEEAVRQLLLRTSGG